MAETPSSVRHHIYLLSVWREEEDGSELQQLRFRLEDPRTGEQKGFSSLEMLLVTLKKTLLDWSGEIDT